MRVAPVVALAILLAACGQAPEGGSTLDGLKDQAADVAGVAARAAGEVMDTTTICTLAGKPEAFCGCLASELGDRIEPQHIEALTGLLRDTLDGAIGEAAQTATNIDPKTRDALVTCGTKAAIEGASEQQ